MDLEAATVRISGSIVTAKSLPQKYARKDSPKSIHSVRLLALDMATAEMLRRIEPAASSLQDSSTGG